MEREIKVEKEDMLFNVLSIGEVKSGETASATITGKEPNQVLNLTLPKGDTGATGATGAKGDKGDAPIKGTDYWTNEDKQEILNDTEKYVDSKLTTDMIELTNNEIDDMWVDKPLEATTKIIKKDKFGHILASNDYNTNAIVKITTNKQLQPLEGWELSDDGLSLSKTIYETIQITTEVTIASIDGDTITIPYYVLNVDSEIPTLNSLNVTSVKSNNEVEVQFTTKILKSIPIGWEKADNKMKKFKKDIVIGAEEPVILLDKWLNEAYYYVKAEIDSDGNANVTQREADEEEIAQIKATYHYYVDYEGTTFCYLCGEVQEGSAS